MIEKDKVIRDADVIEAFDIPFEMAEELSTLLVTASIRQNLLVDLIDKPIKFEQVEAALIPIQEKISTIKSKITSDYVPEKYRSEKYTWYFAGLSLAGNECWIKES